MLIPVITIAQESLKGMIMDRSLPKGKQGVYGANVYWLNTNIGATTNEKGWFTIPYKKEYTKLVVSYIGYRTDTITITENKVIHHFLTPENTLEEVKIKSKKQATQKSF